MDTTKIFDFMLGLSVQVAEEAYKFKTTLENEYNKILTVGSNNNSDTATTELVVVFLEDLRYKLLQG